MINENFIYFGVFITELANISYFIDTIKGKIKPNRVSYFLWALAPLIAFSSQIRQGVGLQSLSTFIVGFNCTIIFLATFVNKKSYWKLTVFDFACGFLSLAGLILWMVTKIGNMAIIFGILADGLACLPTIRKAYLDHKSENVWPYVATLITSIITLLTIKTWSFANSSFSIYLLVINLVIIPLIAFDFRKLLKTKT